MYTYSAKELRDRALALADLKNSSFLSYGELFHYMNDAYREVYTDSIKVGDTAHLRVVRLEGAGSRVYDLPDDVMQILSIVTEDGVPLHRKDPRESEDAPGYSIVNGQLFISKAYGSVIMKYYPVPETITVKAREHEVACPITPVSGYGSCVIDATGTIYDLSLCDYVAHGEEEFSSVILGKYTYVADGREHSFDGEVLNEGAFVLREDGVFVKKSDSYHIAVCDMNEEAFFVAADGAVKYINGDEEKTVYEGEVESMRYVFFEKHAAVITTGDKAYLVWEDGTIAPLNSNGILLKCDMETGYGFLEKHGTQYYVNGWLPDTHIDYPSNTFFSMVAYKLAIAFRVKQNADITLLKAAYDTLHTTYATSLSIDSQAYPTIRNVYSEIGWW